MKLTVIVDNMSNRSDLLSEWGYAAMLETEKGSLLFDTGRHAHTLLTNMKTLGFRPGEVQNICLSHGHFDHCGGLGELLSYTSAAEIWGGTGIALPRFTVNGPKVKPDGGGRLLEMASLHLIDDAEEILPDVTAFVVPQESRDPAFVVQDDMFVRLHDEFLPDTFVDDLSMVVRGSHGYSVLLGCAHAGVPNILARARDRFGITRFHAVIGGMHLNPVSGPELQAYIDALKQFDVALWRPNHCTGFRAAAALSAHFDNVDWAGAGRSIEL